MLLNRLGNKKMMANKLLPFFPEHTCYIEPFFGAGGLFFRKPLAKYNIMNDADEDVSNLFFVLRDRSEELYESVLATPYHESLLEYWEKNKETCPIQKATRFLFLSNYTYLGSGNGVLRFDLSLNTKKILLQNIAPTLERMKDVQFTGVDFRKMFGKIRYLEAKENAFIYCDPPYLGTTSNYAGTWTENDAIDLFEVLHKQGIKFAISEFDNPIILELAKSYNLNINILGERFNLRNRRTEILITNYENSQTQIFTK